MEFYLKRCSALDDKFVYNWTKFEGGFYLDLPILVGSINGVTTKSWTAEAASIEFSKHHLIVSNSHNPKVLFNSSEVRKALPDQGKWFGNTLARWAVANGLWAILFDKSCTNGDFPLRSNKYDAYTRESDPTGWYYYQGLFLCGFDKADFWRKLVPIPIENAHIFREQQRNPEDNWLGHLDGDGLEKQLGFIDNSALNDKVESLVDENKRCFDSVTAALDTTRETIDDAVNKHKVELQHALDVEIPSKVVDRQTTENTLVADEIKNLLKRIKDFITAVKNNETKWALANADISMAEGTYSELMDQTSALLTEAGQTKDEIVDLVTTLNNNHLLLSKSENLSDLANELRTAFETLKQHISTATKSLTVLKTIKDGANVVKNTCASLDSVAAIRRTNAQL